VGAHAAETGTRRAAAVAAAAAAAGKRRFHAASAEMSGELGWAALFEKWDDDGSGELDSREFEVLAARLLRQSIAHSMHVHTTTHAAATSCCRCCCDHRQLCGGSAHCPRRRCRRRR
jgi:hypothetical protein